VWLELWRRYHTADSQPSRFGNSAGKSGEGELNGTAPWLIVNQQEDG
jgi:hypothetical protein